ncbi:MAG: hypothetical protein Q8934_10740 [Bacillota bacterium]|nr:hypothetical protein [Bacillota bacterium]
MEIISCTEAGKILNKSKKQVREMVEQGILANYTFSGNRYMVSTEEVLKLCTSIKEHPRSYWRRLAKDKLRNK